MSDLEKDSIIWAKIMLIVQLVSLAGMLFTSKICENEFLFNRLAIIFIVVSIIFVTIGAFVTWQVLYLSNKKSNDEED